MTDVSPHIAVAIVPDPDARVYEPPTVERLGTLAELTQGAGGGHTDGASSGNSGSGSV